MLPIIAAMLLTGLMLTSTAPAADGGLWKAAQALPDAPEWKAGSIGRLPDGRIGSIESQGPQLPSTVQKHLTGLGTGFFISKAGHVLTNNHVIADCSLVSVENSKGEFAEGRVIAADPQLDLAVLGTPAQVPSVARFRNEQRFAAGDQVSVVGFPTRKLPPLRPQRSEVLVVGYNLTGSHFEVRGEIWPGNSGGPAFDADGLVGGVVVAAVDTPEVYRKTGKLLRDIGIVISQSTVTGFLERADVPYTRSPANTAGPNSSEENSRRAVVRLGCWNR